MKNFGEYLCYNAVILSVTLSKNYQYCCKCKAGLQIRSLDVPEKAAKFFTHIYAKNYVLAAENMTEILIQSLCEIKHSFSEMHMSAKYVVPAFVFSPAKNSYNIPRTLSIIHMKGKCNHWQEFSTSHGSAQNSAERSQSQTQAKKSMLTAGYAQEETSAE